MFIDLVNNSDVLSFSLRFGLFLRGILGKNLREIENLGVWWMDDPKRIVLDISSDEDVGWGERGVTCGGGGVRDDGDWISELLDEVRKTIDDSDELMVLGEVPANPQKVAKPLVKSVDNKEDDDDDDLVILDGDPDKPVTVENDGGQDSDDLCILGEKGQV